MSTGAALATESERAKKLEAALGATKEQSRHLREQLDAAAEAESRREAMHAAQLAEQQDLLHRMSALRSPTDGGTDGDWWRLMAIDCH